MHYIQRLPFILGASAALAAGALGYIRGVPEKDLYIRMAVSMVIFYAVGFLVRSLLLSIKKEIEEMENREKEEEMKSQNQHEIEATEAANENRFKGRNVDLRVDESREEFTPFTAGNLRNINEKDVEQLL